MPRQEAPPPGAPETSPAITAVLLDADGVVQYADGMYPHFDRVHGWPPERLDDFFRHLFLEREDYPPTLTGAGDLRVLLAATLPEWGWRAGVDRFVRDWLAHGAVPDPAALDLVAALRRRGVRCGLASNQEALRARYMDEALGYRGLFDDRFYSVDLGYAKPDPDYFRTVLAAVGSDPTRVLFVDDRAENVAAARYCGMPAELLAPDGSLRETLARYALPVGPAGGAS